jgi:RNA polymerase sigma-70 factor, ECF subfamily
MKQDRDDVEAQLRGLIGARAFEQAASEAIQVYGPELFGFLVNFVGNEADAGEVWSQTAEDLWRGLPSFRGECSTRTWLYLLARHAGARYLSSPWNRGARTGEAKLDALVADVRSRTDPWLRTDVKDRWQALRESLDPDDRALLVLRVDRNLSWTEVASVMLGTEAPSTEDADRESARLRKRFQFLKEELRRRARAAGLLEERS